MHGTLHFLYIYLTYCMELDCKTVGFFLKISKESVKACRKSLTRAKRESLTRPWGVSPQVSLSVFSLVPHLLFDCSRLAYLNTQKYGLFCSLVWNMCENLHYQSVYFKELHNQKEYYCPTIYRTGAAVVSTITSYILLYLRVKAKQHFVSFLVTCS